MSEKQSIRVMIVDDHQMVRRGLGLFLRAYDDIVLVGEAENGEDALRLYEALHPDVILMDIMMPGLDGIEATRLIKQEHPEIHIIALSSSSEMDNVTEAVKAGATSYLLKNISDDHLINAIRAARVGQGVLAPEATQALVNATKNPAKPAYNLTERELQVLSLIVEGLDNPTIAERINLSRSTVKYHISSLFTKLHVTNRSEAISLALKNNLLP